MIINNSISFFTVLLCMSLVSSCTSPDGGSASGGVSTTSGPSSSSDSSNNDALLGFAAAALVGTVLYRTIIKRHGPEAPKLEKQLPVFLTEGPSNRKWQREDAAYVVFTTKADALNKKRHTALCEHFVNKFHTDKGTPLSRNKTKTFPTVWPTVNQYFNKTDSCHKLVAIYDDNFSTKVLHEGNFPEGRGPFLVAHSNNFKPKGKKLYWNLSDYEIDDFSRQISKWHSITSKNIDEMEKVLSSYNSVETTRRVVMNLGKEKAPSNLNLSQNH